MGAPSMPQTSHILRVCCGARKCIQKKKSRHAVGHYSACVRGPGALRQQDAFVTEAEPALISKAQAIHGQVNLHNMAALPEKEQPTAVNDRAGYIFPSSQFEQADLK